MVLGTVRREYTCLQFSADGMWLYCGTASADVVTVNVQRRSVQVSRRGRALMYDSGPTVHNSSARLQVGARVAGRE